MFCNLAMIFTCKGKTSCVSMCLYIIEFRTDQLSQLSYLACMGKLSKGVYSKPHVILQARYFHYNFSLDIS